MVTAAAAGQLEGCSGRHGGWLLRNDCEGRDRSRSEWWGVLKAFSKRSSLLDRTRRFVGIVFEFRKRPSQLKGVLPSKRQRVVVNGKGGTRRGVEEEEEEEEEAESEGSWQSMSSWLKQGKLNRVELSWGDATGKGSAGG